MNGIDPSLVRSRPGIKRRVHTRDGAWRLQNRLKDGAAERLAAAEAKRQRKTARNRSVGPC